MGTAGVDWLEKFELAPLRDPVWARVGTLARRARRGPGAWPSSRPHGVCEPAASNPDGFKRSRVLRNQVWSFTRTDVPLPTASAPWKGGWVSSHPEGCCNRGNATYGWSWLSSHFPGQSQGWRQHRTWRLTIHCILSLLLHAVYTRNIIPLQEIPEWWGNLPWVPPTIYFS